MALHMAMPREREFSGYLHEQDALIKRWQDCLDVGFTRIKMPSSTYEDSNFFF